MGNESSAAADASQPVPERSENDGPIKYTQSQNHQRRIERRKRQPLLLLEMPGANSAPPNENELGGNDKPITYSELWKLNNDTEEDHPIELRESVKMISVSDENQAMQPRNGTPTLANLRRTSDGPYFFQSVSREPGGTNEPSDITLGLTNVHPELQNTASDVAASHTTVDNSDHRRDPIRKTSRKSELDSSRAVSETHFLVSLVRIPESTNPEHVFILLEGVIGGNAVTYFMDFIAINPEDLLRPNLRKGKVRVERIERNLNVEGMIMIYMCKRKMMIISENTKSVRSWNFNIISEQAEALIDAIGKSQNAPPEYNVFGGKSVFAFSSAMSSSTETGHNCFTWACDMLHKLNDKELNGRLPTDSTGFIVTIPSKALPTDAELNYRNNITFSVVLVLVAVSFTSLYYTQL